MSIRSSPRGLRAPGTPAEMPVLGTRKAAAQNESF